ncbi:hypothetical protein L198_05612 [Cryptococcus wingfieldii CBS 7118]|uniref:Uncharacterized protein n=1 Tax=Cryptococcus wingfieldii CBS 7118 TaxID=1295528 RepID=A0A1E3IY39_9TREE|nr:hypothetical protein L198_05612 [Cryptococcus wingfieldii CBS 7118]ODN92816.1 hypothetical protein L198_05612 [Cryptococcus wingfieldii CBS 7118]
MSFRALQNWRSLIRTDGNSFTLGATVVALNEELTSAHLRRRLSPQSQAGVSWSHRDLSVAPGPSPSPSSAGAPAGGSVGYGGGLSVGLSYMVGHGTGPAVGHGGGLSPASGSSINFGDAPSSPLGDHGVGTGRST